MAIRGVVYAKEVVDDVPDIGGGAMLGLALADVKHDDTRLVLHRQRWLSGVRDAVVAFQVLRASRAEDQAPAAGRSPTPRRSPSPSSVLRTKGVGESKRLEVSGRHGCEARAVKVREPALVLRILVLELGNSRREHSVLSSLRAEHTDGNK